MSSSEDEDAGLLNDADIPDNETLEDDAEEEVPEEESDESESDADAGDGEGADADADADADAGDADEMDIDSEEDEEEDESEESDEDHPADTSHEQPESAPSPSSSSSSKSHDAPPFPRAVSPTLARRSLFTSTVTPKTFAIEPVSAIPHPSPTYSLGASLCLSYLLTGSEDGYIRCYDIFSGLNGKMYLTAPQRHHCGLGEAMMKASTFRTWWDNPVPVRDPVLDAGALSPVYSLAVQQDALWGLSGTNEGTLNLFTIRHDPGRIHHQISAHKGPISALALQEDEKGVFSAGWDGMAMQCDLNTGQIVRSFPSHGAQLTAIAIRPANAPSAPTPPPRVDFPEVAVETTAEQTMAPVAPVTTAPPATEGLTGATPASTGAAESKPDEEYDPLFDDEPADPPSGTLVPTTPATKEEGKRLVGPSVTPLLDTAKYAAYSSDVLMTASIDGQVTLWDRRVNSAGQGVGRLDLVDRPPWCISACWSNNGSEIYVGRRNATVDVWDVRLLGVNGQTPRVLKTLRNPSISGPVTCVAAFPDSRHIVCASQDNIRLWNVHEESRGGAPFKIIAGHHGGIVSQILVDASCKFMITASGNRGWSGESTKTILVHEVKSVL